MVEQLDEDGSRQELGEDVAKLALGRDLFDDELLVDGSVAQPDEPDCEVFASFAVAALPC